MIESTKFTNEATCIPCKENIEPLVTIWTLNQARVKMWSWRNKQLFQGNQINQSYVKLKIDDHKLDQKLFSIFVYTILIITIVIYKTKTYKKISIKFFSLFILNYSLSSYRKISSFIYHFLYVLLYFLLFLRSLRLVHYNFLFFIISKIY